MWIDCYVLQVLLVGVQVQEELRGARQDATRQHVQLKLDLRTAQLTSAALHTQVRQCHTSLFTKT